MARTGWSALRERPSVRPTLLVGTAAASSRTLDSQCDGTASSPAVPGRGRFASAGANGRPSACRRPLRMAGRATGWSAPAGGMNSLKRDATPGLDHACRKIVDRETAHQQQAATSFLDRRQSYRGRRLMRRPSRRGCGKHRRRGDKATTGRGERPAAAAGCPCGERGRPGDDDATLWSNCADVRRAAHGGPP